MENENNDDNLIHHNKSESFSIYDENIVNMIDELKITDTNLVDYLGLSIYLSKICFITKFFCFCI